MINCQEIFQSKIIDVRSDLNFCGTAITMKEQQIIDEKKSFESRLVV